MCSFSTSVVRHFFFWRRRNCLLFLVRDSLCHAPNCLHILRNDQFATFWGGNQKWGLQPWDLKKCTFTGICISILWISKGIYGPDSLHVSVLLHMFQWSGNICHWQQDRTSNGQFDVLVMWISRICKFLCQNNAVSYTHLTLPTILRV